MTIQRHFTLLSMHYMLNIVHKTRVHVWRPASQDFNIFIIIHMLEAHRRNERCSWYKFISGLVFFHRGRRGMVLLRESWFFYTIQEVKALNCFLLCQLKITDLFNLIASTPARIWGGVGGGMSNLNLLISRSKFTKKS